MSRHHPFWALRMLLVMFFAVACLASLPSATAEFVGSRADDEDPQQLLVITNQEALKPQRLRKFSGTIVHSEPSPNGHYVGAIVVDPTSKDEGLLTFVLYVMDAQGEIITSARNAQDFKFSPHDRYVAVVKGPSYEGAEGFLPKATEIIDLKTQERWTVPKLRKATAVSWRYLPGDDLTLVARLPGDSHKVWKYPLSTRQCEPTSWKGIHFSPDGQYYFVTPKDAIEAGLCRPGIEGDSCLRAFSWRNEAVKLNLRGRVRRLLGWAAASGHRLVVTQGRGEDAIYNVVDLATGHVKRLEDRIDHRWNTRQGVKLMKGASGRFLIQFDR